MSLRRSLVALPLLAGALLAPALTTGCGEATPGPGDPSSSRAGAAEKLGAKHLLVMYAGSERAPAGVTRSKDEARALATQAAKEAHAPGARFEELVARYSDEPGAARRGGDLGTFKRGMLVPAFQEALDALKVGEISEVVETSFGFHVILRTK